MIIAQRQRFSFDRLMGFLQWMVLIGCVCVGAFFVRNYLQSDGNVSMMETGLSVEEKDLGRFLTGPLALRENRRSPLAISLEGKLALIAQNMRPDLIEGGRSFRIGVKGLNEEVIVHEGEAVFCDLSVKDGVVDGLVLGSGDVKMVPQVLDQASLLLKVERGSDVFDVVLRAEKDGGERLDEPAMLLKGAKWWGHDRFFEQYGGERYKAMGGLEKLIVGNQALFVGDGDFLSFDGKWKVLSSLDEAKRDALLARVKVGSGVEIEVWDEKGFSIMRTKLAKEQDVVKGRPSELIQGAKLRSAHGVSCKIGKKQWILKPGDWLFQTALGWHRMRGAEEIDAYLNQEILGELIVIDGIDKTGILTGHIFDKMRTQMIPFSIRVQCSKSTKEVKKK